VQKTWKAPGLSAVKLRECAASDGFGARANGAASHMVRRPMMALTLGSDHARIRRGRNGRATVWGQRREGAERSAFSPIDAGVSGSQGSARRSVTASMHRMIARLWTRPG